MSPPLVTVAVPTFRRIDYLPAALESALSQTLGDLEIIVSDNAMSEEVRSIVRSFGDDRLIYRHNGENIGSTPNTVAACTAGSGRYVAVLHDDDVWEPEFLERLVAPLERDPTLVLAFSDYHVMRSDGTLDPARSISSTRLFRRNRLREGTYAPFHDIALVDRAIQPPSAVVVRRSSIDWSEFPQEMDPMFDNWLAYLACRDGGGAWFTPERLCRYRTHDTTLTTTGRWNRQLVWMYSQFAADDRLRSVRSGIEEELARFKLVYATDLLSGGDRRQARDVAVEGLRRAVTARGVVTYLLASVPGNGAQRVQLVRSLSRRFDRRLVRY